MEKIQVNAMKIAGLKITTNNKWAMNNQTIAWAWNNFFEQEIFLQIEEKLDTNIYWVYTNFEENFDFDSINKNYDLFIGCVVPENFQPRDNIEVIEIPEQKYMLFTAKWIMPDAVISKWQDIWSAKIPKNYSFDIEIYWDKSQNAQNSEVDILIWVN